jgi:catechol 2,3-dioxygenase-like lactoylglutathione lyase family enzyme
VTEPHVALDQVNLVVEDMSAALDFYRRLGVEVTDPSPWPPGSGALHAHTELANGFRLEFDNFEMARIWHAATTSES